MSSPASRRRCSTLIRLAASAGVRRAVRSVACRRASRVRCAGRRSRRVDLLDARDLELQLGERARRRHRERPGRHRQHREDHEHDHHERRGVDDLEHQPHGRAEDDRCQPCRRVGEHRLAPTGHQGVRISRPPAGPSAVPPLHFSGSDPKVTGGSQRPGARCEGTHGARRAMAMCWTLSRHVGGIIG